MKEYTWHKHNATIRRSTRNVTARNATERDGEREQTQRWSERNEPQTLQNTQMGWNGCEITQNEKRTKLNQLCIQPLMKLLPKDPWQIFLDLYFNFELGMDLD